MHLAGHGQCARAVTLDRGLGHFNHQTAGGQATALQRGTDRIGKARQQELGGRHVDRDPDALVPIGRGLACLIQNPFAQFDDQTVFIRKVQDFRRRYVAAHRMLPPQQGFIPGHFTRRDHRLHLIEQRKLPVLHGVAQVITQCTTFAHVLVQRAFIIPDRMVQVGLGTIHGQIGARNQGFAIRRVNRIDRDANAAATGDHVIVNGNGLVQRLLDTFDETLQFLPVRHAVNGDEFIPTQTGHELTLPRRALKRSASVVSTISPAA